MREKASMTRKPRREGLAIEQPAIIGAEIERAIDRRHGRPRRRARVSLALGCRHEAIGRRHRMRTGCDLRRAATSPAVAGLASHGLGSREAMAAGRALPLGPFTMFNLSPPEPPHRRRVVSVRCVGPMGLIYQAIVRGKAACSGRLEIACDGLERRRKAIDSRRIFAVPLRRKATAPVAQRIEHQTSNLGVARSSRAGRTIIIRDPCAGHPSSAIIESSID